MKNTIIKSVSNFLKCEGIPFEQPDGEPMVKTGFRGDNGYFVIFITADDEDRLLEAFTMCPLNVPKAKLAAVTELIARINCRLRVGNFDIDLTDGEVGFRVGIRVGDTILDRDMLGGTIFGSSLAMDRFFPAIASVVYGNVSTEKAIAALRKTDQGPENHEGSSKKNRSAQQ